MKEGLPGDTLRVSTEERARGRTVDASLQLIDDIDLQVAQLTVELRHRGADHRYIPLLAPSRRRLPSDPHHHGVIER